MKRFLGSLFLTSILALCALPLAHAAGADDDDEYRIAMVAVTNTAWDAIRYHAKTGKAWVVADGKWVEIKETGKVPASEYRVHMVALMQDWGALRIDVHSGRSWRATPTGWSEILEPAP